MRQAEHLKSSYQQKLAALDELKKYGELSAESVIRKFRITADQPERQARLARAGRYVH